MATFLHERGLCVTDATFKVHRLQGTLTECADRSPLADALRRTSGVVETSPLPAEVRRVLLARTAKATARVAFPFPEIDGADVLIVGRGPSSEGFHKRFPGLLTVGVNPGSLAQIDDKSGLRHFAAGAHFDAVLTCDIRYLQIQGAAFLKTYEGPVLGPTDHDHCYDGPGTYHGISELVADTAHWSIEWALRLCQRLGAKSVTLTGVDFGGDYHQPGRAAKGVALARIAALKADGIAVLCDINSPMCKDVGEAGGKPAAPQE